METARAVWIAAAPDPEERARREKSNAPKYVYHNGIHNVFADFHGLRHTGIKFVVRKKETGCTHKRTDDESFNPRQDMH
jgi:hypothetical protein